MQEDTRAHAREVLLLEGHLRHRQQHLVHDVVAVDVELALVLALVHEVCDLAHDPDDAEHVVRVAVRDEHVMALLVVEARELQLAQDAVAATRIRQEQRTIVQRHVEARVVAFRHHGIARAEHRKFSHDMASHQNQSSSIIKQRC